MEIFSRKVKEGKKVGRIIKLDNGVERSPVCCEADIKMCLGADDG